MHNTKRTLDFVAASLGLLLLSPAFALVVVAGVLTAAVGCAELGIVRIVRHRPALTWNIDHRYLWSLARGFSRTGGFDEGLDYAGVPVTYHGGPAWIAGAVDRLAGGGADFVLFIVIPFVATLAVGGGIVRLLRVSGVSTASAVAAAGVGMTLPGYYLQWRNAISAARSGSLLNGSLGAFGPELMLNSLLACAIGVWALAIMLDDTSSRAETVVATVGLACLAVLKPQYFVAFGGVAGVLAVARVARPVRDGARSRLLALAAAALACAVTLHLLVPHLNMPLGSPVWSGDWRRLFNEANKGGVVIAVITVALSLVAGARRRADWPARNLLLALLGCAAGAALCSP